MANDRVIIRPALLHRLLVRQAVRSLEIEPDLAILNTWAGPRPVELASVKLSASPAWGKLQILTLETSQGAFVLQGISSRAIGLVQAAIDQADCRRQTLDGLLAEAGPARRVIQLWEELTTRDGYVTESDLKRWLAEAQHFADPPTLDARLFERLPDLDQRARRRIATLKSDPHKAVDRRNTAYAWHQLKTHAGFFDTVESNPLTDSQRQAIVYDEDNALVIAGAGTGKTSTIVGKVGFVLRKGWARPDEILLLAFTAKAAEAMRERIERKLGADVKVRTFHSLGLEIIAQAQGKKPSLCAEAEDAAVKAATIKTILTNLMADHGFCDGLLSFQSSLRRPFRPRWEFATQAEYIQYLLEVEPRALTGRLLKSYEECEIANWLVQNGIRFEYERPYEVDVATLDHRQYKPDFYLPDYRLFIEHWGVDRSNRTAPFVDQKSYIAKMDWARETHAAHGTKLVETYSWERQEDVLLSNLETKLRSQGVRLSPVPISDALKLLNESGRVDPFVTLLGTFISLFKSAHRTIAELAHRANRTGDTKRTSLFLRLFEKLFTAYETFIHRRGEIDFDDMIVRAREHVEKGTYRSGFRYILIDEFQDMARDRAELILALRNQVLGSRIFAVGDDWQSIYRFAGSDISLTTAFDQHFGFTRKTALDRTFRFHNKIADFSSCFVQRNPSQLRKQLTTVSTSPEPGVVVWMRGLHDDPLPSILAEISRKEEQASVFLLARYQFALPGNIAAYRRYYPGLTIKTMTAHASKGLEADFVIVDHLKRDRYGFPSEVADDPVLALVLPEGEQFAFAEERRLFYVALTRARKRAFLIADAARPSVFVQEIIRDNRYEKEIRGTDASVSDRCPICEWGQIERRNAESGMYYCCSNSPICTYRGVVCTRCQRGRMRETDGKGAECDACGFLARPCPRCHQGFLRERRSRKTGQPFWGCSRYGAASAGCDYTEKF